MLLSTLLVLCGLIGFGSPVQASQYDDLDKAGLSMLDPYIFVQALEEVAAATSVYSQTRKLQQDPAAICELYNTALDGELVCTCARFDRRDTKISCDYVESSCNADSSICYNSTIDIIVNVDALSSSVKQCTYFNTSVEDTCITVVPSELGNYTSLASCDVTLNSEECNYCAISDTVNTTISATAISFDCCNVLDDKKSTNNQVGSNGGSFPNFDFIELGDEGQCSGNNQGPGGSGGGGNGGSGAADVYSGAMTLVVATMTVAMVGAGWLL